jgi:hypothetical protein
MIPVHPTLMAFLARERYESLLEEANHHRLLREARQEGRGQRHAASISLTGHTLDLPSWPAARTEPAGGDEGGNSSAAA